MQLQQAATNLIAMDSQITQLKAEKMTFQGLVDGYNSAIAAMGLGDKTPNEVITIVTAQLTPIESGMTNLINLKSGLNTILSGLPSDDTQSLEQSSVDA
ncbi:MAG: hypothetical protein ACK5L6_04265 [Anaerorhabdus sp.]|uniref:hypothetical protein n=1 Tax=Anaerorhabdus sp. TaxID=1872524 RepID=UPI003A845FB2